MNLKERIYDQIQLEAPECSKQHGQDAAAKCEYIAEKFAIEFAMWVQDYTIKNKDDESSFKELFEIFKSQNA